MKEQEKCDFPTREKIFSHTWEIFSPHVGKCEISAETAELECYFYYCCLQKLFHHCRHSRLYWHLEQVVLGRDLIRPKGADCLMALQAEFTGR